jgi:two-component system, response regulator YesN
MDNLYNLAIVDDEFFIRKGLASFEWEKLGFKVAGVASDGKECLDILKVTPVDVVISDIKMPIMDGLTLSERVHKEYTPCRIILLTGYKDFEYAKAAIKSGVYEYLLKPVDLHELEVLMTRLKVDLDNERIAKNKMESFELKLQESLPHAIESFLEDLVVGKIPDLGNIEEKLTLFEISMNNSYYSSIVFQIDGAIFNSDNKSGIRIFIGIKDFLNGYLSLHKLGYSFCPDENILAVLLNFNISAPMASTYDFLSEITISIRNSILEKFNAYAPFTVTAGIGNVYSSILSYAVSYQQARQALKRKYFEPECAIFYSWKEKSSILNFTAIYPYEKENTLINFILEGDMENSIKSLKSFDEECSLYLKQASPENIKNAYLQLLSMLHRKVSIYGVPLSELMKDHPPFTTFINSFVSLTDLQEGIMQIITDTLQCIYKINSSVKTSSHIAVGQAVRFIQQHYCQKITLNQVAEQVHLNPSYFSIQFKREMGMNFIDYLKQCRIEKAKELLKNPEFKVYEISSTVGYENPNYFADTFKYCTGMTPLEFRQKIILK